MRTILEETIEYDVELTDTFGGEANYSWVKRDTISVPSNLDPLRKAKAVMGLTGARGTKEQYGDSIVFRPYGLLQVMFITPHYYAVYS